MDPDTITVCESLAEVPDLEELWADSKQRLEFFDGDFADYRRIASIPGIQPRIVVDRGVEGAPLVAPFYLRKQTKTFTMGERRLFGLRARTLILYSQWMMQHAGAERIRAALAKLREKRDFDWLAVGETPVGSPLANALKKPGWQWLVSYPKRTNSLRWLIDLPPDFDTYLGGLSPSSRQSQKRKMRKLEKSYRVEFEAVTLAEQIPRYLEEGERISRKTYQWDVGQRLLNDESTKDLMRKQAARGELRGYLLSLDGEVRAFLRGSLKGNIYEYETPGFDPACRKDSIGTTSLLYAIRDLIENTPCTLFDFGTGGDETGYKSTFGNRSIPCVEIELGRSRSPISHVIAHTQSALNQGKNFGNWALKDSELRARIKRALRRDAASSGAPPGGDASG